MIIGIIGANSFIGKTLVNYLDKFYSIISITKKNYNEKINSKFDVLIHMGGNHTKHWAIKNPLLDFDVSVISIYKSLFNFQFDKYIYLSSIDVYRNNIYGFHKHLAEEIINKCCPSTYLILRCAQTIGKDMKKGVL